MFKFLDKVANAGAGSVMPDEKRARAKSQSHTTNQRNQLAQVANGYGVDRKAKAAARAQLVEDVGPDEAKKLMKQNVHKVRNSFAK